MAHRRAKPCGSTIKKKTIKPPKIISSKWAAVAVDMGMPNQCGIWLSSNGKITMKAAPKKLPAIDPKPPMMTMNKSWKLRSMENAAGSHELK